MPLMDGFVVLHPKRRVEHFRLQGGEYLPLASPNPSLAREAIAYYQLASHLFRSGLYRDEEQRPPERRADTAALAPAHGDARRGR